MAKSKTAAAKKKRRASKPKKFQFLRFLFWRILAACVAVVAIWVVYLDYTVRDKFDGKKWAIPARVYAQPLELYEGLQMTSTILDQELKSLGYRPVSKLQRPGQFVKQGGRYQIYTKGFAFWDKHEPAARYQLELSGQQVIRLKGADDDFILRLEPQEIGSIYPNHGKDRIFARLGDIPPLLGETLIAVEDNGFIHHHGVSVKGIIRAMWANIKAGGFVQGGSTITQQLVKNFYLTHERSLWRKIQEAVMSILLELHYSKSEILEAYLNEVFLGQSGPRAIHGFGLAAQHYFNQPIESLTPEQIALLVGTVKGASYYNPWRHPERSKERRDLVLKIMAQHQLISDDTLALSIQRPLGVTTRSQQKTGNYPAFLDLVKRQLRQDYRPEDLQSEGLRIFTSMAPHIQAQTEQSVVKQMKRLNKRSATHLQTAAIVTAVGSGEILALVGDSNPRFSGFNRALDAERQVGSLLKPFVFLTALMQSERYQLSSMVDDSPIEVKQRNGTVWSPKNFSEESYGNVALYQALAFSYNQSTARLGTDIGVKQIVKTLRKAGMEKEVNAYPSLLLGATTLTPLDVSHLYHTLAADGVYTPLRAIRSVQDAENKPLQRYALASEPRFTIEESHLMHFALQSVMRIGTGRRAYSVLPTELALAGKTGTTNEQRDSWFAGYSGDHLAVVWVGNDDNKPTHLTGSNGALSIWSDIFKQINTRGIAQATPENIEYYWIDSQNGLRSAEGCEHAQLVPFIKGTQPSDNTKCALISNSVRGWLRNVFR